MKQLNQLAAKPQIISIVLDDEDTIKEYEDSVEFFTYDRQPLEVFLKLATIDQTNMSSMIDLVRTLILDAQGNPVITNDVTLPTPLLMRAIAKVVEILGK